MQRVLPIPTLIVALVAFLSRPAAAADDWSFIAGRYALDANDCGPLAKGEPFSKDLVGALAQEVLTREGITSPREVHCKFRSAAKTENGWSVKADCEEVGQTSPAELAVTAEADASLAVVNEDVYGPEPQKFQLCRE